MKQTKFIVLFLIIIITALIYSHKITQQPLHVDEHAWIRRGGMFFQAYFIDHNFSEDIWQNNYASYDQAKLPELLYGVWTTLIYKQKPQDLFLKTNFNQGHIEATSKGWWTSDKWWIKYSDVENISNIIEPQYISALNIIFTNRYFSTIFALLTLVIIFNIGNSLHSYQLGVISTLLLAQHQLFFKMATLALADSILLFFLMLSLCTQIKIAKDKKPNSLINNLKSGIIGGLAFSSKLNGLIATATIITIKFIQYIYKTINSKNTQIKYLFSIIIVSTITLLIFISTNPFTWPSPIKNTVIMMQYRKIQAEHFSKRIPKIAYDTPIIRATEIIKNTLLPSGEYVSIKYFPIINIILFGIGLISIIQKIYKKRSKSQLIFIFHAITLFIAMTQYLRVGIDRYFLPIIPYIIIIQAWGIITIINTIKITPPIISQLKNNLIHIKE